MIADAGKTKETGPVIDDVSDSARGFRIAETMPVLDLQALVHRLASRPSRISLSTVPPIVDAMAEDAKDNAHGLPLYANRSQFKANLLTTISNTLAALAGLAIWATLQQSPSWWAKAAVAVAALISAVIGFLPSIYHWNENAAKARRLASEYGHLYGDILKVKGQFLDLTERPSDEEIEQLRTTLEALKKQRQDINAFWKSD